MPRRGIAALLTSLSRVTSPAISPEINPEINPEISPEINPGSPGMSRATRPVLVGRMRLGVTLNPMVTLPKS